MRINNTSSPIEFKVWAISTDRVTPSNLEFLKGFEIKARAVFDSGLITARNGAHYRYGTGGFAEFETVNQEQESMLKLLYGSDLLLLTIDVVLPNTYSYDLTNT